MIRVLFGLFLMACVSGQARAELVTFQADDGLTVTADLQKPHGKAKAAILLFHMAGASRGEYGRIAETFRSLGYATLAVDQRSGGTFRGIQNETAARVEGEQSFSAAIPDMKAASAWVRKELGVERVAAVGSSYSASLSLVLAANDPAFADAVLAFSPGEYFEDRRFVGKVIDKVTVPVFLTSGKAETGLWRKWETEIKGPVRSFVPRRGPGRHGASSLLSSESEEYWDAVVKFLAAHFRA